MDLELRVLTLNCWGIPIVSSDRKERMKAIAEQLSSGKYDIVSLQEVWSKSDFRLLCETAQEVLPHSHYFHSGVLGSGVCILSKYRIKEAFFHQWSVNGYIHKIHHGDWFGGKGVGLCQLQCHDFVVNVYVAHLHAEYNRLSDEYRAHRVLQSFDTAQFIRLTSSNAHVVILAGDLNTEPDDLEYRILLRTVFFKDSYLVHTDDATGVVSGTNECAKNSYTPSKLGKKRPAGKRIDYILYKSGIDTKVELTQYTIPLPERVELQNYSYSDHEAVQADFKIINVSGKGTEKRLKDSLPVAIKESIEVCQESLKNLKRQKVWFFMYSVLFFMILVVTEFFEVPVTYREITLIFKLFLSFYLCFTLVMATLWNAIEKNATIAGINSMEIILNESVQQDEEVPFSS